jgi:hypothetical protein
MHKDALHARMGLSQAEHASRWEAAMPLRGRVGRHTKQNGRHCQNRPEDQMAVITLLNRIAVGDGGAEGKLEVRVVNGIASDALYKAISRFENQHYKGQGSGYVDPDGAMFKKMDELAKRPLSPPRGYPSRYPPIEDTPRPPPGSLEVVYRDLLNQLPYKMREAMENGGPLSAEGRDALFVMAARQVKSLQEQNFRRLPWPVAMFGRAYVFRSFKMLGYIHDDGSVSFLNTDTHDTERPKLPEMRFGQPVESAAMSAITGKLDALLLYDNGIARHIPPYHEFIISQGVAPTAGFDTPRPLAGADKFGIK